MKNDQQIESLKALSVDQILHIDGVTFQNRVRALPTVELMQFGIDDVEGLGDLADDLIDVKSLCRITPEHEERMIVAGKYVVVGGLCYDHDAENPMTSCDGQGRIIISKRVNARPSEDREFYAAFGYDEDGEMNLDQDAVKERAIGIASDALRKRPDLMIKLRRLMNFHERTESVLKVLDATLWQDGLSLTANDLANSFTGLEIGDLFDVNQTLIQEVKDILLVELDVFPKAWNELLASGAIGEKNGIPLNCYSHGGSSYNIAGSSVIGQDPNRVDAVWVPDAVVLDNLKTPETEASEEVFRKKLQEYGAAVIDEYNSWLNGDCHGLVVYVIDRETGDVVDELSEEVWGFIGSSYAEEELESTMLGTLAALIKAQTADAENAQSIAA